MHTLPSGDVSSVAAVFRRCTEALSKELGVEPSDQTKAVYERLSKGEIRGYELRQHVSTGEFGSLYRAYHRLVGREVAIKVILPEYANQPDFIRRFDAEAQLIARVEHPHILPLYDYWREPDGAYIVMRWMRGGSLRVLLRQGSVGDQHHRAPGRSNRGGINGCPPARPCAWTPEAGKHSLR